MIVKHGLLGLAIVGSLAVLTGSVGAGSGWLLLAPPLRALEERRDAKALAQELTQQMVHPWDPDAPLERWRQVRAFDTARECEETMHGWLSQELTQVEKDPNPPLPKGDPRRSMCEITKEVLQEDKVWDAITTEEQKQKDRKRWWKECTRDSTYERYRHWKCVPADAVYRAPK